MINLEVKYTVEGNGEKVELSSGFFYPRVVLFIIDGSWVLGTAEGFPRPDTGELAELFGIK